MNREKHSRIEIGGWGFVLFLIYAMLVWLCEAADLFCYLTHLPQVTRLSRVLVMAVMAAACLLLKDRVSIRKGLKKDFIFALGCLVILYFYAYKAVIPDTSTDVKRYHLLVQNPGFFSMTQGESFMPGDFQAYGFRWADRMFYLFRRVLGLRMGTLFGAVISLLLYSQMRDLIAALCGEQLSELRGRMKGAFRQPLLPGVFFTESVLAFAVTLTYELLLQSGGYMVDAIAIPFVLEAIRILISKQEQESAGEMIWFAFLCGCFFAVKMTHVVYIAPVILVYLFKYRRSLTIRRFLAALVVALIPVSIYLLYAYVDTGNPVFPYFNTLFKSPYFGITNFKDRRWGPQNLPELLAWPLMSAINPSYRTSEIPNIFSKGTVCLIAALLLQMVSLIKHRRTHGNGELLLITLASAYLWSASTGHVRYFMLGYMLCGLLLVDGMADSLYHKRWLGSAVSVVMMAIIMAQPFVSMDSIAHGREWSWRNHHDEKQYSKNKTNAFKDRNVMAESSLERSQAVHAILLINANGGAASVLHPDAPIINQAYLENQIDDSEIREYWNERIAGYLSEGGVYAPVFPIKEGIGWESYIQRLDSLGLKIKDVWWPETAWVLYESVMMIELEALEPGSSNAVYFANEENNSIKAANRRIRLHAPVTLTQTRDWWTEKTETICLVASDSQKSKEVFRCGIAEKMTVIIDEEIDLSSFGEDVQLSLYWQGEDGACLDTRTYECLMINPTIEILDAGAP